MSAERPRYDPVAPLEHGLTVLEASAGTGKTWQISTLVTRLVAEAGVPIDEILVVTFTRAATEELVDRVRRRLREVRDALQAASSGEREDAIVEHLRAFGEERQSQVVRRLHDALQRFDQATITTIHGFCQRMLQQNAFESLADPDAELLADDRALREGVRADLLARLRYDANPALRDFLDAAPDKGGCGLAGDIGALLKAAIGHPDASLLPEAGVEVLSQGMGAAHLEVPADHSARKELAGRVRADVARWARRQMVERARSQRVQTYDDLLRSLAHALSDDAPRDRRQRLVEAVRHRFRAALIDEFQDTDRVQWTIFRALFAADDRFLYLIGDPKQAIYGFRGANVHVYLEALAQAGPGRVFTMDRNFRSDGRLIAALNHLWARPGAFGETGYDYVQVEAHHEVDRVSGAGDWARDDPRRAALHIRFFDGGLSGQGASTPLLGKGDCDGLLIDRVAEDVVELLGSGLRIDQRPVGPGDVAILVRSNFEAANLQQALRLRDVPSVRSGDASVFASDEARHLQAWLAAVVEAGRDRPARRAAATPLFGWTAADLAALTAEEPDAVARWDDWLGATRRAASEFRRRGFMVAFRSALEVHDVLPRLLAWPDGERRVTNLLHVAELVHAAQQAQRRGPQATLDWLVEQIERTGDQEAGEAELRLESDDAAVRLMTIHKSKGLQFPIVFVPSLSDGRRLRGTHPLVVPDPEEPARRVVLTATDDDAAPRSALLQQAKIEAARENMRLAYVALTRATHRCVVYAGPFTYYGDNLYSQSPLAALLHVPEDAVDRLNAEVPHVDDPEALWSQVESVAAAAPSVDGAPSLVASRCTPPGLTRWQPPVGTEHPTLEARRYTRGGFDLDWRIHSYSRLTQGRHVAAAALEDPLVDRPGAADEPVDDAESIIPSEDDVPLAAFPGGVQAGTFLHAVLERADFTPSDEDPRRVHELQACIDRLARRHGFSAHDTAGLAEHLAETLAVPLGGSLGSFRLLDLPRRDRLDELRFDLPVQRASGDALARAFSAGADGEGGLRRPYVEALMDLDFATMAGFLTGSIDLVFRRGDRWFIVDYKSNRIDPERTGRTPISNYAQPFLQREMERHHYLVQAYLYTLALHRYLRHRLDDAYDPASHLGGVAYLFLRGMTQPDRPVGPSGREGVYHLRPAMPVVEALDALFEGSA